MNSNAKKYPKKYDPKSPKKAFELGKLKNKMITKWKIIKYKKFNIPWLLRKNNKKVEITILKRIRKPLSPSIKLKEFTIVITAKIEKKILNKSFWKILGKKWILSKIFTSGMNKKTIIRDTNWIINLIFGLKWILKSSIKPIIAQNKLLKKIIL